MRSNERAARPFPIWPHSFAAPLSIWRLHDAFGVLHGVSTYETYNARYMNHDLAHFLTPGGRQRHVSFTGRFPEEFLTRPRPETIPAWHLIGGKDPIESRRADRHRARRWLSGPLARLDSPRRPEMPQGQATRR